MTSRARAWSGLSNREQLWRWQKVTLSPGVGCDRQRDRLIALLVLNGHPEPAGLTADLVAAYVAAAQQHAAVLPLDPREQLAVPQPGRRDP